MSAINNNIPFRIGSYSRLVNKRTILVIAILFILTLLHIFVSISLGKTHLSIEQVWSLLIGNGSGIYNLRLTRVLLSILVGMSIALSGVILQQIIKNPLASPDILAITPGASAAAVSFITFLTPAVSILWLPFIAQLGAFITALCIYIFTWKKSSKNTMRLVLVAIGFSAILDAFIKLMIVMQPIGSAVTSHIWLTGTIYGASWQDIQGIGIWLLLLLPLYIFSIRPLNLYCLDNDTIVGLGLLPNRELVLFLILATAFAGVGVAYGGAIPFIGLMAPHIAKRLVSGNVLGVSIVSALLGANLLIFADTIGRTLFLPLDLPAGIFIAVMGTLFFIYLLVKN